MTDDEFYILWNVLTGIANTAQFFSIEQAQELLDVVRKSETLGPILDPTAYIRGGRDNLADQKTLLEGFLAFRRAIEQVNMDAIERMVK